MQTWAQVLTRARGGCFVHRRQNENPMHRKRARRILGILKKSVSWELDTEREGSILGALRGQTNLRATGASRDGGADEKVIIERLCLSPYVEKPLNSKVIKSSIPELRSRYVFFVFRDSYVLCIYVMNILCTFHISVSWVCYIGSVSDIEHSLFMGIVNYIFDIYLSIYLSIHIFIRRWAEKLIW